MANANIPSAKITTIKIPVDEHGLAINDGAAAVLGKTCTENMLDACCREAADILSNHTLFVLNDADYKRFVELVNTPMPPTGALRTLLRTAAPGDQSD